MSPEIVALLLGIILIILPLFVCGTVVLFSVFAILFSILPGRRRDTAAFTSVRYAHRGLHSGDGRFPENSISAFRLANKAGFGAELDVQFTKDKQIVVFHDDDLKRMCGIDKRVDELDYAELKELPLLDSDQHIPLLIEALEALDGATLLCEFKTTTNYDDTSLCDAAYPILKAYKGDFCVESFNPLMMRWFKKNAPEVVRGVLAKKFEEENYPKVLRFSLGSLFANFLCRPDFIAYRHTDSGRFFFRLCRKFRPATIAWTVQSQEEETKANKLFDTIIFEGYMPQNKAI